jgi:hypothetical protein
LSSRQAKIRAAVLAGVLAVHGLAAAPLPSHVSRAELNQPLATAEIERWAGILQNWGVDIEVDELKEKVFVISRRASSLRKNGLAPFRPLLRLTGTGQGWGFFNYPDAFPDRLQVEARAQGEEWDLIFQALHPEHDFLSPQLRYRRVRGLYDGNTDRDRGSFDPFVDWVSEHVFAAYPDYDRVRVSFLRTHTLRPGLEPDDMEEIRMKRVRKRESSP